MKKLISLAGIFGMLSLNADGQDKIDKSYRNFPVIVSVQFHSLTLPFKNLGSNFSNVGIGVGTEISYNGKQNWAQQFSVLWYRNKNLGNGVLLNTQTVWRPTIADNFYAEVKAGLGYNYSSRPVESFKSSNGEWVAVGHKGKGMLALLTGVSGGYSKYSDATYASPFVSYQLLVLKGYNNSIPIVPETLIQVGSRVHL
jgi:hypothetical protein